MSSFKDNIEHAVSSIADSRARDRGLCILRVIVRGTEQNPVIEIVLDGPRQVLIEDCEAISREVNEFLEEKKTVKGNFRLDVMSPGLDEPLKHEYQFERSIGRLMEIAWQTDDGRQSTVGYLRSSGDTLVLESQKKKDPDVTIPKDKIESARLLVDFKSH